QCSQHRSRKGVGAIIALARRSGSRAGKADATTDATLKDLIQTRIASAKAKAAQKGVDLFLMAPAQGKTLDVGMGQKQTKADRETYLLSLLQAPSAGRTTRL